MSDDHINIFAIDDFAADYKATTQATRPTSSPQRDGGEQAR